MALYQKMIKFIARCEAMLDSRRWMLVGEKVEIENPYSFQHPETSIRYLFIICTKICRNLTQILRSWLMKTTGVIRSFSMLSCDRQYRLAENLRNSDIKE